VVAPVPLPASATKQERAILAAMLPSPDLAQAIDRLPTIKEDPPDVLLPWLIWEYGLTEVAPYIGDLRKAVREGAVWKRYRLTPRSLELALSWIGLTDIFVEEESGSRWVENQIDPGRVLRTDELPALSALTRLSLPQRSRLARVYHGFDARRLVLSESTFGSLLSDYSGVDIKGVRVSFGRSQSFASRLSTGEAPGAIASTRHRLHGIRGRYADTCLLGEFRFGEAPIPNHPAIRGLLHGVWAGSLARPGRIHGRAFSRAQLVLSDGGPLGSLEAVLGPRRQVEIGRSFLLGESLLSEEPHRLAFAPVDLLSETRHCLDCADTGDRAASVSRRALRGHGWQRRLWPVLSETKPALSPAGARARMQGFRAVYRGQNWTGVRWPKASWKDANVITGSSHVSAH